MTDTRLLAQSLDLVDEGIRYASLTFSINFFTDVTLSEIPGAVLRCQEIFFDYCPKDLITFYATENMRKHKPVTQKVFGMLDVWMKNPGSKTDYIVLELKDGSHAQDAPKYLFKLTGCEKDSLGFADKLANSLSFAFPPEFGLERSAEMFDLVREIGEVFPYQSGSAGFAFYCSRYEPKKGESFAWQKSMRHPEINIVRIPQDIHAVEQNALKTIGWLTMLNNEFIATLGGIETIKKGIGSNTNCIKTKAGYLFKIGDTPIITDRNRNEVSTDYTKLYEVFSPLIELAENQSQWFDTGGDEDELTRSWYQRFKK